ncbi:hypothetical protein RFF05_09770 [Bengtsoniella intestinalis]|uniref:hypothetical protein n=1 Tax=Bengtsoniella intestinalis TaxID=3073143 RepID=UPI00391FA349
MADYMGNDQLLPAYNIQLAVCDQYSPFHRVPVANADYRRFNNHLFYQEKNEKFMKLPMCEKESKSENIMTTLYRATNFPLDEEGNIGLPQQKAVLFYAHNVGKR